MSPPDWAASSRIKIKRANQHISELEAAVNAWSSGDPSPHELVADLHEEAGTFIGHIRIKENVPPNPGWGAILGDAIHNLSAALDTLIHQMVLARGETPNPSLQFRVFDTRAGFEKAVFPEIARAGDAAMNVFKGAEPYKGGKSPLWTIRRLDEQDKHRVLVPICIGFRPVRWPAGPNTSVELVPGEWKALENGAILHSFASNFNPAAFPVQAGPEYALSVSLSKTEFVPELEPIGPMLRQSADFIDGFVTAFAQAVR